MSTDKEKLSIIIVNYNSSKNLLRLITSISQNIDRQICPYEILVVDNNSSDQRIISRKLGKKNIKIIKNKSNLGFSKAVNQAIKLTKNEIVLLLNPDCLLTNNSLLATYKKIQNNKTIGIIGGKIKNLTSNKIRYTATQRPTFWTGLFEFTNLKKIFPNNKLTKNFWIEKKYKIRKPIEVFSLCGAYLFIRKHGPKNINYLSENYFLYLEDLDLGYKIEKNQQKAVFDPESFILHKGGGSNNSRYGIVLKEWYKSRKTFFLKNLPKYQGIILYIIFSTEEIILNIYHRLNNTPNA